MTCLCRVWESCRKRNIHPSQPLLSHPSHPARGAARNSGPCEKKVAVTTFPSFKMFSQDSRSSFQYHFPHLPLCLLQGQTSLQTRNRGLICEVVLKIIVFKTMSKAQNQHTSFYFHTHKWIGNTAHSIPAQNMKKNVSNLSMFTVYFTESQ